MSRARRLVSAVVAASLAVGGLSACRTGSSVAVYLGDTEKISEQQVQEIWDDGHDRLTEQARAEAAAAEKAQRDKEEERRKLGEKVTPAPTITAPPVRMPFSRIDVVHAMVTRDLYDRVADQRGVTMPANLSIDDIAAEQKLPVGTDYARLKVEILVLHSLLLRALGANGTPADADLKAIYNELGAVGGIQPGQDFAAWKAGLPAEDQQLVAGVAKVRDEIQTVATDLNITVNPRYEPFEVSVLRIDTETIKRDLLTTDFNDYEPLPVTDQS
jgi:hypothetical protein